MVGEEYQGRPGQIIDGRFELLTGLGRGGMGAVWRARDLALEREVALKEVRLLDTTSTPDTAALRDRVLREARALARISHPHVVTVHHIVDVQPFPWIVMELLPGRTLASRLKEGPVPPDEVLRYGRELLSALRAVHAAGLLHRDVKPANVLLRADGSVVLTDFGVAAPSGSGSAAEAGRVIGSPEYLAPERVRGGGDDPASDLWSLGMLLYALVEGHVPLRRPTPLETLRAVAEDPVPPTLRAGPLSPVLRALLVKDPAARPDADQLERMLAGILPIAAAPTVSAPPPPVRVDPPRTVPTHQETPATLARPAPPGRRRRLPATVLAVLLLGGGITAGVLLVPGGGTPDDGRAGAPPAAGDRPPVPDGEDGGADSGEEQEAGLPAQDPDEELTETSPDPAPTPPATARPTESGPTGTPAPDPTRQPVPGEGSVNTWIAQLFSEPVSSGTAARDQRLTAIRAEVPEARVLRSDDFGSLNPGYWVIYAPGPFTDGNTALRFCADRGRTTANECVGRYLSHDPADREYLCRPERDAAGRCER